MHQTLTLLCEFHLYQCNKHCKYKRLFKNLSTYEKINLITPRYNYSQGVNASAPQAPTTSMISNQDAGVLIWNFMTNEKHSPQSMKIESNIVKKQNKSRAFYCNMVIEGFQSAINKPALLLWISLVSLIWPELCVVIVMIYISQCTLPKEKVPDISLWKERLGDGKYGALLF